MTGADTERIEIVGVSKLHGARHSVLPDRIETGTYAMAVAMAGGDILLHKRARNCCKPRSTWWRRPASRSRRPSGHPHARNGGHFGAGGSDHRALPGLSHRSAGAVDGADDARARHFAWSRPCSRTAYARAGTGAAWSAHHFEGERATIEGVDRLKGAPVMANDLRASGVARDRGTCRRRRDHRRPRLSPRPRLRAA